MSSYIDPELLIIEVESRPLLYSKSLPNYSNRNLKNDAWEEITKNLTDEWENLTKNEKNNRCKDIQLKWKNIRDCFRREYQSQNDKTSGSKQRKKYRYFDKLLFLIPYIKDAKTSGNYSTHAGAAEQNTKSHSKRRTEKSRPTAGPSTPKKKKTTSYFEDAILKAFDNEKSEMDEDRTFCLSLVQSLKKMADDKKMSAKIDILKLIRTYLNKTH